MTTRYVSLLAVMLMLGFMPWMVARAAAPPTGVHTGFTAGTGSTDFTTIVSGTLACSSCHGTPTNANGTSAYGTGGTTWAQYGASSTLLGTNASSLGTPGGMPAANVTYASNTTNSGNMSAYIASFQTPQLAAPAAITMKNGSTTLVAGGTGTWAGTQINATPGSDYLVDSTTWSIGVTPATPTPFTGLAISTSGLVSASTVPAPASPTVYTATITATNASANPTGGTATFTIAVNAAQTITATPPVSIAMGTTGNTFSATGGGSGNAITVSGVSTTYCTASISGSTVTVNPVSAGPCTFTLNQAGTTVTAGSAGYDAGTKAVSISITQGTQTVTAWTTPTLPFYANNVTATIGATLNSGLTPTSYSSTTTSICTVSGTNVTGIAAGTCTITAAQAGNTNWLTLTAGVQTTSFAVSLAPQTITMPAPSVVVGGGAVALAPAAPSGLTVTLSNTTTGQCTLAGSPGSYTLTGLHAGTNNCVLNATVAGNTQYAAVSTPQALNVSIGQGTQTISAGTVPSLSSGGTAQLAPTSTSPNTILYSSGTPGVCSVSSAGLVTAGAATGGQTCTILLDQNASADYLVASQLPVNFTVGLYGQTITLGTVTAVSYQPAGTTYGTGTISATASNSAVPTTASPAVTFTSNTPTTCTVVSSTGVITGKLAGTNNCTIVGDVAGVTGALNPATLTFPPISILQTGQTLAFGTAPAISVGVSGTISATSTSAAGTATGLAVTYGTSSASSICTVSSTGTVTGTGVGTCVVTANQAGDSNYSAAAQKTQNVTIAIGSQTLVWGAVPTINYQGTGAVAATSQVTSNASPTGLSPTYTSQTPSVCSVVSNTGVVTGLAGGTCTIAANQSGTVNYSAATQVTQSFAINPIAQSISMTAVTGLVVGGTATLSSTTTSGLAVTYSTTTTSVCSVSGNVVTAVGVGTCIINANQSGNASYQSAMQATQNVTVGQGSQSIVFGTAPAVSVGGTGTLTATATSGLAVAFTSLTTSVCTVSGSTVTGVTSGTCTIAANQPGDVNWTAAAQTTLSITVVYLPPTAGPVSLTTQMNTAVSQDLLHASPNGITGIGVTGVSVSAQPAHGSVSVSGTKVTYAPGSNYFGTDTFTYVAYNNGGVSPAAGTVTVTITGRPDPTKDTRVTGLISDQTATVQRFGMVQVFNFQQRLESRHHALYNPSPLAVPADTGTPPAPVGGALSGQGKGYFNSWQPGTVLAYANDPNTLLLAPDRLSNGGNNESSPLFGLVMNSLTNAITSSSLNLGEISNVAGAGQDDAFSRLEVWAAGSLRFGTTSQSGTRTQFSTDGISVGVDRRMDRKLTVGMGMGYARDKSDIGTDGTNSTSSGNSIAGYASYQMDSGTFVDALLGYGKVNFDTNRYVPAANDFARASRTGDQIFGSLSLGYEYRKDDLLWSPYGRYDYSFDRLNAGTESGTGANALSYASQNLRSTHLSFGMRGQSVRQTSFGVVQPHARFEYQHSLQTSGQTTVSYADLLGVQYAVAGTSQSSNAVVLGLGADFLMSDTLRLGVDYQRLRSAGLDNYQSINFRLTKDMNGKNDLESLLEESYASSLEHPSGLVVAAGFAYDDNVSRASEVLDKMSDTIYNLTISKGMSNLITRHTKLVVSGFMDIEKFRNYAGLGHVSGGVQGEYMYRTSGDFGAPTFGIFARYTADQYESMLRDGSHSSAGLTLRKPLTDRINLFAALADNVHSGKSDVFNSHDVSGRMNFDYALAENDTLYLTGEYRKGDIVSSGTPSLKILDVATVFAPDDAFAAQGYSAYRMKGQTALFTLGYNIAFGNKDSIDMSWRHVQSTSDKSPVSTGSPLRYTVNQLSISYLMAF